MSIEIYRSITGTADAAFSLLATLPEGGVSAPAARVPGGSFDNPDAPDSPDMVDPPAAAQAQGDTFPDQDVQPQQIYLYKARRKDDATGTYSGFSPLVYARAPWPGTGDTTMPVTIPPFTGIQTKLGIGLQDPTLPDDAPVQAARLLKVKSHSLDMELTDPDVEILANVDTAIEEVPSVSKTGGSVKITASPEGIMELLIARYGLPATSVMTAAVVGPPAVGQYWDHTFKSTTAPSRPVTLTAKKGPAFFAFPGSVVNSLDVSADKTQNTPVEMDLDVMALNRLTYGSEAALGLDVAGFDPLVSFGSAQIFCYIGDLVNVSPEARTFSLKSGANMGEEHTLNGKRGPSSHYKQMGDNSGSMSLYFKTVTQMNQFMGVLAAQATPYGVTKKKFTIPLRLLLQSEINAAGFKNEIEYTVPKATYKKHGTSVEGPDAIMQAIDYKGLFDLASGTSLSIRVRNQISPTQLAAVAAAIVSVPLNDNSSYSL